MPIKITIVDDHPLVVEGLYNVFNGTDHIQIIDTYPNGDDLIQGLQKTQPDVLLLDMQLPERSGSELAMYIREHFPQIDILILSGLESPALVKSMIQLGCKGYLLKNTTDKTILIEAVEKIYHTGEIFLDPSLKESLLSEILKRKKQEKENIKLSRREKEILTLIIEEYSNSEIAEKLSLSQRTIENHKYNLFQKLNVKSAVGLIKTAIQRGLLQ